LPHLESIDRLVVASMRRNRSKVRSQYVAKRASGSRLSLEMSERVPRPTTTLPC